ncbi:MULTISPECIES: hypothetical protein [Klebsiella]|uniref:hypothetical protein n=1 Tax=Klebsiella TaxID=570 RepID=UPI0012B9B6D9|nr:hypothetical protein [Klebsiella grimontii]EKV6277288.1 hypothetical protein [Klebsiella pneumoniae]HBT2373226.1 hypothetical protein [Klebsiella pneumoniae subsp. pneumoniae]HBV4082420.1 hypothetical protein [Klebsiella quasipneumoniae]HBV9861128.1 hypothetical protein [Klebsiella pneumoniae]HBW7670449.1 hypothetical protein [Klebsiella pneumoniae]
MLSVKVFAPKVFYFCIWSGILLYIFFVSVTTIILRSIDHEVATTFKNGEGFVSSNPISVKQVDLSDVRKTMTLERLTGVKWNYYNIGENNTIGIFSYHQIKDGDILTITSPTEKVQKEFRSGQFKKFEEFYYIESLVKNSKNAPFVKVCVTNGNCFSAIRL